MMEWSNENVLLLIEKYRELLWNVKHQFYYHKIKTKLKKNNAWEEIQKYTMAEMKKKKINIVLCSLQREKI